MIRPVLRGTNRWSKRYFSASSIEKADFSHVIIGGGVVGLAVACKLAAHDGASTLLLERHSSCGTETSSRNSEVIHAGIYYGPESLKTKLCIRGKHMLYDLCEAKGIPYKRVGKWIVAQDGPQQEQLQIIHEHADALNVHTNFVPLKDAKEIEPDVVARAAILNSPSTGIIDSHALITFLESDLWERGGEVACNTKVEKVQPLNKGRSGWEVWCRSGSISEVSCITADTVVNCAGLAAIDISNSILPPERRRKPLYAKGSYFTYNGSMPRPKTLIYPAPQKGHAGLGTHLTMDLAGQIRFGPDVEWVDDCNDLTVNDANMQAAIEEIMTFLPSVQPEKFGLDYCGIRPKLGRGPMVAGGTGGDASDFIIRREEGFSGFVNLLGIESPGLTSALAIGEMVDDLLYE